MAVSVSRITLTACRGVSSRRLYGRPKSHRVNYSPPFTFYQSDGRPITIMTNNSNDHQGRRRHYTTHTPAANMRTTASDNQGLFLLERAAKEAQALQLRVQHFPDQKQAPTQQPGSAPLTRKEHLLQVQEAMNVCETLLRITNQTSVLAASIRSNNGNQRHVACLHRALLSISQWCIGLVEESSSPSSSKYNQDRIADHLLEHPLLDSVLQLAVRAHQLGLPFHLPLYQKLAKTIAEQPSIHSPSQWILQVAQWARVEMGSLPPDFFNSSLLALTERQRSTDCVHVLQAMHSNLKMGLSANATREILLNFKGGIRSMWGKKQTNLTPLQEDCREIVCLLEASIWNIVDAQNHHQVMTSTTSSSVNSNSKPSLRDAIEVILSSSEDELENERIQELHDLLLKRLNTHQDENEVDENEVETVVPRATTAMTTVTTTGVDEELSMEESNLLYTRPLDFKDDIPDITFQIRKHSNKSSLRYSQEMERDIYFDFCPLDEDEDDS